MTSTLLTPARIEVYDTIPSMEEALKDDVLLKQQFKNDFGVLRYSKPKQMYRGDIHDHYTFTMRKQELEQKNGESVMRLCGDADKPEIENIEWSAIKKEYTTLGRTESLNEFINKMSNGSNPSEKSQSVRDFMDYFETSKTESILLTKCAENVLHDKITSMFTRLTTQSGITSFDILCICLLWLFNIHCFYTGFVRYQMEQRYHGYNDITTILSTKLYHLTPHVEDLLSMEYHYLYEGEKLWFFCPTEYYGAIKDWIKEEDKSCDLSHQHQYMYLNLKKLEKLTKGNLFYHVQKPGDIVFVNGAVFHSITNITNCTALAINYAPKSLYNIYLMIQSLKECQHYYAAKKVCAHCEEFNVGVSFVSKLKLKHNKNTFVLLLQQLIERRDGFKALQKEIENNDIETEDILDKIHKYLRMHCGLTEKMKHLEFVTLHYGDMPVLDEGILSNLNINNNNMKGYNMNNMNNTNNNNMNNTNNNNMNNIHNNNMNNNTNNNMNNMDSTEQKQSIPNNMQSKPPLSFLLQNLSQSAPNGQIPPSINTVPILPRSYNTSQNYQCVSFVNALPSYQCVRVINGYPPFAAVPSPINNVSLFPVIPVIGPHLNNNNIPTTNSSTTNSPTNNVSTSPATINNASPSCFDRTSYVSFTSCIHIFFSHWSFTFWFHTGHSHRPYTFSHRSFTSYIYIFTSAIHIVYIHRLETMLSQKTTDRNYQIIGSI